MKATGVVRRVDDLGRIVIPKEIRRTMRMREGDPLEIFIMGTGEVVLKKYSMMQDLTNISQSFADTLFKVSGINCVITDQDKIISATGNRKKDLLNNTISREVESVLKARMAYFKQFNNEEKKPIVSMSDIDCIAAVPIIAQGDAAGLIMFISEGDEVLNEVNKKLLILTANLLVSYLEN